MSVFYVFVLFKIFDYVNIFVNNNNVKVINVVSVVLILMKFFNIYKVNVMIKMLIINFLVIDICFIFFSCLVVYFLVLGVFLIVGGYNL